MGFGGQYFQLKVDQHLKQRLGFGDNGDVDFIWDVAHILELAKKDVRKEEMKWIEEDVTNPIADVLRMFSFGKLFEKLLETAAKLELNIRAPQWFSDT